MSKEKPEAGDVWETNSKKMGTQKMLITGRNNYALYVITDKGVVGSRFLHKFKNETHKYLGKSKVNIKELFDVEEN